nr:MAG TPA: hypothetical protein [Caudoviricetes sp.]
MNCLQKCTFFCTFFSRTWGVCVHRIVHSCTMYIREY